MIIEKKDKQEEFSILTNRLYFALDEHKGPVLFTISVCGLQITLIRESSISFIPLEGANCNYITENFTNISEVHKLIVE